MIYVDIRPHLIGCDHSVRDLTMLLGEFVLNSSIRRVIYADRHVSAVQLNTVILHTLAVDYVTNKRKPPTKLTTVSEIIVAKMTRRWISISQRIEMRV